MQANALDRYQTGESPIHRLDPRVKVVVTVLFILSNVLLPDGAWLAFALAWGLILLISELAGLGLGYALKRSFVACLTCRVSHSLPGSLVPGIW
jgi:energy-coupling factor transporter transmembrane protein EcfT